MENIPFLYLLVSRAPELTPDHQTGRPGPRKSAIVERERDLPIRWATAATLHCTELEENNIACNWGWTGMADCDVKTNKRYRNPPPRLHTRWQTTETCQHFMFCPAGSSSRWMITLQLHWRHSWLILPRGIFQMMTHCWMLWEESPRTFSRGPTKYWIKWTNFP